MLRAFVLLGCLLVAQAALSLNKNRLSEVAVGLGMGGYPAFIETAEGRMEATPEDLETGNFEIKCSTSCAFVKQGAVSNAISVGKGQTAYEAAQALGEAQTKLAKIQKDAAENPKNVALQSQIVLLTDAVNQKVTALQEAAGGTAPGTDLESSAAALALAQRKLDLLVTQRQETGTGGELIPEAKATVDRLRSAVESVGSSDDKPAVDTVALNKRLEQLKAALAKQPESSVLKAEMSQVKKSLTDKESSAGKFVPKNECSKVCMTPKPAGSGRRLLSLSQDMAFAGNVDNCIKMCIKTMKRVVAHMSLL